MQAVSRATGEMAERQSRAGGFELSLPLCFHVLKCSIDFEPGLRGESSDG